MKKKGSFLNFLVKKGMNPDQDSLAGLPLKENVTIYSDLYGIPHVYAENEEDAMTALGYLHARDRLWQLETIRRFASGRLSEVAGPSMVDSDHFSRLAGFSDLQKREAEQLDDRSNALYQAYVDGINGYIQICGKKLPLEFTSLNLEPEPFTIQNAAGALSLNAWYLQTNYLEEIIALTAKDKMTIDIWNALFPSSPDADLPHEDFFEKAKSLKVGDLIPAALGFYGSASSVTGNSNIWVHGKGKSGAPLLANDPHLGMMVPQVWYFCHLNAPGLNVCGGSLPGLPGIVIGRTEHVAWGMTNVMTDCCDLYLLKVDPDHPTKYKIGRKEFTMTEERSRIDILGGDHKEITIYRTLHGPAVTRVQKGIEAVAALKWYGTLAEGTAAYEAFDNTTFRGIFALNRATSKKEFLEAAELVAAVGQNIVYADTEGNIGWYATGRLPKRKGYSGRLPADGSSGKCDWNGFYPAKQNPSVENPKENYFINANNKSAEGRLGSRVTYSWGPPYRRERIEELLKPNKQPGPDNFRTIQKDILSKRAERMVPVLTGFTCTHPDAVMAIEYLKNWDYILGADSIPALLFHVFRNEFSKVLLLELLGKYYSLYPTMMDVFYAGIDHLLITYPEHKGASPLIPPGKDLPSVCEQSLVNAVDFIKQHQGPDPRKWSWGRFHAYNFQHPGGKGRLSSWLLNRGPYPADGGTDSVNMAFFAPANPDEPPDKQYTVTAIPSLRMTISMENIDENYFIGPLGQSGMPGYPHYDDMIEPWMENRQKQIPLSKEGAAGFSTHKQILEGKKNSGS